MADVQRRFPNVSANTASTSCAWHSSRSRRGIVPVARIRARSRRMGITMAEAAATAGPGVSEGSDLDLRSGARAITRHLRCIIPRRLYITTHRRRSTIRRLPTMLRRQRITLVTERGLAPWRGRSSGRLKPGRNRGRPGCPRCAGQAVGARAGRTGHRRSSPGQCLRHWPRSLMPNTACLMI